MPEKIRKPTNPIHEQILTLWKKKIKDLNLARQRISAYPESHPTVVEAVKKVSEDFKELLSLKEEISFSVFRNKLLIDDEPLELEEEEEDIQKEFALCLHKRGVENLTFSKGLETEDIYKFLKLITTDPKIIIKQGGIAQLFLENGLIYIRANESDIANCLSPEEEDKHLPEEYQEKLSALKEAEDKYSLEEKERIVSLFEPIDRESLNKEGALILLEMLKFEEKEEDCGQIINEVIQKAEKLVGLSQYEALSHIFKGLSRIVSSKEKELAHRQELLKKAIDDLSFKIIDNLISGLNTSRDEKQREEILALFSQLSKKVASSLMERLSEEEDDDKRFMLISAIISLEKDSGREIMGGLDSPKWYVVRDTVHILKKIKDKSSIHALLKPLRHQEVRVRLEVIEALGEMGDPEALSLLVLGLKDKDTQVRKLSLRYLIDIGGERSVTTLLRILKSGDYNLKMEAINALGEMGSHKAVNELDLILKSFTLWGIRKNNRLRASAAKALGKIGTEEAIRSLRGGAKFSFSHLVKEACQEALGRLSNQ